MEEDDIKGPSLDIHRPKFDAGLDNHESKLGLPKVDVDINAPKIGSRLIIFLSYISVKCILFKQKCVFLKNNDKYYINIMS